jgi:hypothetical protein
MYLATVLADTLNPNQCARACEFSYSGIRDTLRHFAVGCVAVVTLVLVEREPELSRATTLPAHASAVGVPHRPAGQKIETVDRRAVTRPKAP